MLHLHLPPSVLPERLYAWRELLERRLGIDFAWEVKEGANQTRLSLPSAGDHEIIIPDIFFPLWDERRIVIPGPGEANGDDVHWRSEPFMDPGEPIIGDCGEGRLPLVYFSQRSSAEAKKAGRIILPFDLPGAVFQFLSRIEELAGPFDAHGRFPGKQSWAARHGLLYRPLVDEYEEVLRRSIESLWPGVPLKNNSFKVFPTHDVDWPFVSWGLPLKQVVRSALGDIAKRRDLSLSFFRLKSRLMNKPEDDPAYTYDFIMDISESLDLKSTFFFIAGGTNPSLEGVYRIDQPEVRAILQRILTRGHNVGIHGSYHSLETPGRLKEETDELRQAVSLLGYDPSRMGGRQHFLRGYIPVLWRESERAGLEFDSTLGFADMPGFRAGTCREYRAFDVFQRKELSLTVKPLIVMDRTLRSADCLGLDENQARSIFLDLKRACARLNGEFVLLWHNTALQNGKDKEDYASYLSGPTGIESGER